MKALFLFPLPFHCFCCNIFLFPLSFFLSFFLFFSFLLVQCKLFVLTMWQRLYFDVDCADEKNGWYRQCRSSIHWFGRSLQLVDQSHVLTVSVARLGPGRQFSPPIFPPRPPPPVSSRRNLGLRSPNLPLRFKVQTHMSPFLANYTT